MSDKKLAVVKLMHMDGDVEDCELVFLDSHEYIEMVVTSKVFGRSKWTGSDAFHTLELFRNSIEPKGWKVLCNGSRKDSYPSGMCRDMGRGFKVYIHDKNDITSCPQLVETFEFAESLHVGTVKEQYDYWKEWLNHKSSHSGYIAKWLFEAKKRLKLLMSH